MSTAILIACLWFVGVPLGYVVTRLCVRSMCSTWNRNDRLFAIVFSLLYGPVMPVLAIVLFLLHKLAESKWGNLDARW